MRIRIALATVVAAIGVTVAGSLMSPFRGDPGSAQATQALSRHQEAERHDAVRIKDKLMSYSQARQVAKMVTYANAVQATTFFKALSFLHAVDVQEHTIPAAWLATAICEEGGRNDPYAGYFGILEWHHFDDYPTAGSAPLSVQLAWEARYVGGPPDAPGQCHGY